MEQLNRIELKGIVGNVRIRMRTDTPEVSALTPGSHGKLRVVYIDIRHVLLALVLANSFMILF